MVINYIKKMFGLSKLPDYFKPILWSYNFDSMDAKKHKKTIIINSINYGDLRHWSWIADNYGKNTISDVLGSISVTEIRPRVRQLASLMFSFNNFNYVPRGTK